MKLLRNLIIALLATVFCTGSAQAIDFGNERLNYQIVFHWGVIWKHAGNATLSIKSASGGYQAMLTGATRSWADKIYPVRDTLLCSMNANLQPLRYEKITHEKDYYARDLINFSYNYSHTKANCKRFRKGGTTEINLSAKCQAYDMVSVFYMLRNLDFDDLANKKSLTTVIFSGKEKEYLTIRYKAKEMVKMRNGTKRDAYHIIFKFTQEGGKKSSSDLNAWISTDSRHIPLVLSGSLSVGEVKCYYTE